MSATTHQKPRTTIKALAVKLDDSDRRCLEELAEYKKRSTHYLMREAISEYIKREEADKRFIQRAEQASREFKETGVHLTFEEYDAWLETWGTDNEKPMPICHT